ncbi:beta-ketoacyl synthase [Marivirga sp. S37H4]|uniref:Beta-ketoacyl synthase n=1 Tax=Marivirga aurantiaca TaxID=2802615 RepID=A0A934WYU4_9BACT|nr:beta-ketoacyl synthase N-terminal-like domain-containing protein [Marivirga aurantiaca]MBK6265306.1 beta-ketoacyl synthase [Marivirga aurantiaca]
MERKSERMKMHQVFTVSDGLYIPLGSDTQQVFKEVKDGVSSIKEGQRFDFPETTYVSQFSDDPSLSYEGSSRLEAMAKQSIKNSIAKLPRKLDTEDTGFIICTTKGNIDLLEPEKTFSQQSNEMYLFRLASKLSTYFGIPHKPIVISNACTSSLLGLIHGMRMIMCGKYKHVIVTGADIVSAFTLSGFRSLKALSSSYCKPFDNDRDGINLGEGAGTIIISADASLSSYPEQIILSDGFTSNDGTHISAPHRNGEGLHTILRKLVSKHGASTSDFISAHGTGTKFNDAMEARAITRSGLQNTPIHSLKRYFGHTLGACGIVESIICIQGMLQNLLIPSLGLNKLGTDDYLNMVRRPEERELRSFIKMGAGFGGCNAVIRFQKAEA